MNIVKKINAKITAIVAASAIAVTAATGSAFGFQIPSFVSNLLPSGATELYNSVAGLYNSAASTYNNIASLATAIAEDPSILGSMGAIDYQKYYEQIAADIERVGANILDPARATGQAATATGTAILSTPGQAKVAEQVKAQTQFAQSANAAAQNAVNASSSLVAIGENTKAIASMSNQIAIQHAATVQGNQIGASIVQGQATTNAELEKAANDRDRARDETKQLINIKFSQPLMVKRETPTATTP